MIRRLDRVSPDQFDSSHNGDKRDTKIENEKTSLYPLWALREIGSSAMLPRDRSRDE